MSDYQDQFELEDWGLPPVLAEEASWFHASSTADGIPVLNIPEDISWFLTHRIDIFSAVRKGAGIRVVDSFDLSLLKDVANQVQLLWCGATDQSGSLSLIEGMANLRILLGPLVDGPSVQLSHLKSLEHLSIGGRGMLSGLAAPALMSAGLDLPFVDSSIIFSPTIEALDIRARRVDLRHIYESVPRLQQLKIFECKTIDLAGIETLRDLEWLLLVRCGEVRGTSLLQRLRSLRKVELQSIGSISDVSSLLKLELDRFYGVSSPDLDDGFAALASKVRPHWGVEPSRARSRSKFTVIEVPCGFELQFNEWAWLNGPLDRGDLSPIGMSELEEALLDVANRNFGANGMPFEFDSEDTSLIAVVQSASAALELRELWDQALIDLRLPKT